MSGSFLTKTYVLVVLLVFLVLAALTFAFAYQAYVTTKPSAATQTQQQINTLRENVTPQSIFINNFFVSIYAVVPVAGPILFGKVCVNTAQIIGQLAYSYHMSPFAYVIGVYTPIGTIENLAYSVILAESVFLTAALAKGNVQERLRNQTWKSLILYVAILAFSATLEAAMIRGI